MEDMFSFSRKWIVDIFYLLNRTTYFLFFVFLGVNLSIIIYGIKISDEKLKFNLAVFVVSTAGFCLTMIVKIYGEQSVKLAKELDEIRWPIYAAGKTKKLDILKVVKEYKVTMSFQMISCFAALSVLLYQIRFVVTYIFLLESYVPYLMLHIFCWIYFITVFCGGVYMQVFMNSYMYFFYHLRIQLLMINHLLEKIDKGLETLNGDLYQKQIKHRLIKCIKHHQNLWRLFIPNRNIYNRTTFILVPVITSLEMAAIFYIHLESPTSFLPFVIYVIYYVGTVIAVVNIGASLVEESLATAFAAGLVQWDKWDRGNRFLLLNLLVHAQNPMVIYVGSLTITYELFIQMLKTAYSIYCVLHAVHNT